MSTWPLIQRNKVEDSKVNVPVEECTSSENETLAELAKKVRTPLHMNGEDLIVVGLALGAMGHTRIRVSNTQAVERGKYHACICIASIIRLIIAIPGVR